jgi:hypothetical protein
MTDRYVIVYRDGYVGEPREKWSSDAQLDLTRKIFGRAPAYRIRIRDNNPYELHLTEADWRTVNCLPKRAQS